MTHGKRTRDTPKREPTTETAVATEVDSVSLIQAVTLRYLGHPECSSVVHHSNPKEITQWKTTNENG